jgi:hypothetical protein
MIKKNFHKLKNITNWTIKQSWFFSASLFLGLAIIGKFDNVKELLVTLVLCLIFWGLDALFLKKIINMTLHKILEHYKKRQTKF